MFYQVIFTTRVPLQLGSNFVDIHFESSTVVRANLQCSSEDPPQFISVVTNHSFYKLLEYNIEGNFREFIVIVLHKNKTFNPLKFFGFVLNYQYKTSLIKNGGYEYLHVRLPQFHFRSDMYLCKTCTCKCTFIYVAPTLLYMYMYAVKVSMVMYLSTGRITFQISRRRFGPT